MKIKTPIVDYRKFRFNKLGTPEFSHLLLLLGWVGYFSAYFLTENLIPAERCTPVHCPLDDMIPFCEYFVIPYVLWYLYLAGTLLFFGLYNVDGFRRISKYIIITQICAMTIYVLFPTRQDLRPETLEGNGLLVWLLESLYSFDTSTNVCPSLHVAYSLGLASVWVREKSAGRLWKVLMVTMSLLVCLSTVFIKQHSVLDFVWALPMCLLAEIVAYGRSYWLPKFKRTEAFILKRRLPK